MNTSQNHWKLGFVVLAVVAGGLIGYLVLQLLDQSMTLGMLRDGFRRREDALTLLRKSIPDMVRANHPSQQETLAIIQKHNHGAPVVSRPSTIEMDQMRFCFAADGSLDRIEQTDDYGTRATDTPTNRPTIQ
jgi:hypothetical protein